MEITLAALATVRMVLGVAQAHQNGDRDAAIAMLSTGNLAALGLTGEILQTVQLGRATMTYLSLRGIFTDQAVALIAAAEAEGRDVTSAEVEGHFALTQAELDETQAMVDAMDPED